MSTVVHLMFVVSVDDGGVLEFDLQIHLRCALVHCTQCVGINM